VIEVRPFQDENRSLVERLIRYKSKDADKMNEENENFVRYDFIYFVLFIVCVYHNHLLYFCPS
jgi:hypothetical protein